MGLRAWLLGMDPEEVKALAYHVQELEKEVIQLKAQVRGLTEVQTRALKDLLRIQANMDKLRDKLENKADKKEVDKEFESLSRLVMAVYDKLKELESVSELSSLESLESNEKELLVLDYIRRGEGSPSKLLSRLQLSSRELYDILRRLEKKKKIGKVRKGRKVYYVLIEE
jgi:uncharacterized membrane protein